MPGIVRHSHVAFTLAFVFSVSSWAQTPAANSDSGDFEILGLRLGMNAKEVAQTVQQHLKISLADMRMDSTPRHYQHDGTFIDVCVLSNARVELVLDFTEVFPGKGEGPEALYSISYTPTRMFAEDADEFDDRVVAKYGAPTLVSADKRKDIWLPRPYRTQEDALRAGAPILELDRLVPKLSLVNPGIRRRMEDAYHESHKVPL